MRPPEHTNGRVKAWKLRHVNRGGRTPAELGTWLVHDPGAHMFWSWWVVICVHLRPFEGEEQPANLQFPEATHEFVCMALQPSTPKKAIPMPRPEDEDDPDFTFWPYMTPADWVVQVQLPTDEDAVELLDLLPKRLMEGNISLDQDYRQRWISIVKTTAGHYRGEHSTKH
jgi:hypothetical protein